MCGGIEQILNLLSSADISIFNAELPLINTSVNDLLKTDSVLRSVIDVLCADPAALKAKVQDVVTKQFDQATMPLGAIPAIFPKLNPDQRSELTKLHGYRGDRRAMLGRARWLAKQGVAGLLYDARGHGDSGGERISFGDDEAADLVAAANWLGAEGIDQFFAIGFSQGAVTIIMAADQLPGLRGAVLESAFDTLEHSHDRAFRHRVGLPGWLAGCAFIPATERLLGFPKEAFRPIDHLADLRCPVSVIGGSKDPYTWQSDTEALFSAARPPKQLWVVRGAEHEDFLGFDVQAYTDCVGAFLHANGMEPSS